jgi:hypothetical protein
MASGGSQSAVPRRTAAALACAARRIKRGTANSAVEHTRRLPRRIDAGRNLALIRRCSSDLKVADEQQGCSIYSQ